MRRWREISLPLARIRTLLKWLPKLRASRPVFLREWPRLRRIGIIPRGWVSILKWRRWGPLLWNIRRLIRWSRDRPMPWWWRRSNLMRWGPPIPLER